MTQPSAPDRGGLALGTAAYLLWGVFPAFFHLLGKEEQLQLAQSLAGLLSPKPGSIIFGWHVGSRETGDLAEGGVKRGHSMFCYSPEDWVKLWDGQVFEKGTVEVEAELVRNIAPATSYTVLVMQWSVTRL